MHKQQQQQQQQQHTLWHIYSITLLLFYMHVCKADYLNI